MGRIFCWFFGVYFLLISACPRMDISQLWYIADALRHFNVHFVESLEKGQDYNLWSFFSDHYVKVVQHTHENGESSHDQLPAQQLQEGISIAMVWTIFTFTDENVESDKMDFSYKGVGLFVDFSSGVDHPPSLS